MNEYKSKTISYLIFTIASASIVAYGYYYESLKYVNYAGFILVAVVLYLILMELTIINKRIKN